MKKLPVLCFDSVRTAFQFFLDVVGSHDLGDHAVDIQTVGIMGSISLVALGEDIALHVELIVIEAPSVGGDPEIIAHVGGAEPFLAGHQGLEEFFAVAGSDDFGFGFAEDLHDAFCKVADGAGIGFLNEQIAGFGMFESECDQVHRFVQVHQETGHIGIGDRDGGFPFDLVDEKRDDRTAGTHDVAVTGAGEDRAAAFEGFLSAGLDDFFTEGFGHAHGVDRISGLVGGEEHHAFNLVFDCSGDDIVGAEDVGADCFNREEFAGRNFFQGGGMEDIVGAEHDITDGIDIPDIADIELDFAGKFGMFGLQEVPHGVLFLFIAADDPYFPNITGEKMFENGRAERTGPARNDEGFVFERIRDIHWVTFPSL